MEKILISACLIGDNVKYDGKNNLNEKYKLLLDKYELVPFCAEVTGGLSTPRIPSEIKNNQVINQKGKDVTFNFVKGAKSGLELCKYLDIKIAILKDKSPSCGVHQIYDGNFNHTLVDGQGVLANLLQKNGIKIYTIDEIDELL